MGRNTFQTLLADGLLPFHRLLDFGCGSLRNGYWLIRFLDAGNYFGIEPVEKCVRAGLKHLVGPEIESHKKPRFLFNSDNDMGAFNVPFDYVVARSILSHTCPGMLHRMLETFSSSSPQGTLFASYWRHDIPDMPQWWQVRSKRNRLIMRYRDMAVDTSKMRERQISAVGDDLPDDDMRFIQIITYSLGRMQEIAATHGLSVQEDWTFHPINQQIWLKFKKQGA
ncbi:MAG: class I SAM-dependent methyltransferase [Halioglobus sp.]|nr:class I SAM-dependent methyltransferase [Halioglobus sp.]